MGNNLENRLALHGCSSVSFTPMETKKGKKTAGLDYETHRMLRQYAFDNEIAISEAIRRAALSLLRPNQNDQPESQAV